MFVYLIIALFVQKAAVLEASSHDQQDRKYIKIFSHNKTTWNEDGSATLKCAAVGNPTPIIEWVKNEKTINTGHTMISNDASYIADVRSMLVINPCEFNPSDKYSCTARSDYSTQTMDVKLNLTEPKGCNKPDEIKPRITLIYNALLTEIGNKAVLPCRYTGHPTPEVYWMNDYVNITWTDPRVTLDVSGDLVINPIKWDDLGLYSCIVSNRVGQDYADTFVYPMAPS